MSDVIDGWAVPLIPVLLFLFLSVMLALPGIVARSAYFTHPFDPGAVRRAPGPAFFWTLVLGTSVEVAWLWLHHRLTGRWFRSEEVLFLLSGSPDTELGGIMVENMVERRLQLLGFLCAPLAMAAGLGAGLRWVVLRTGADRYIPLLRYPNRWYYILSGRMRPDDGRLVPLPSGVNYVRLEVLCREGDRHVLFSGRLTEFRLLPDDGLQGFRIDHPFRRYPEAGTGGADGAAGDGSGYEAMEVGHMEFRYEDVIDLRVFYYVLEAEVPAGAPAG